MPKMIEFVLSGDMKKEEIEEQLHSKTSVKKYHFILHDKDTSIDENKNVIQVENHWHVYVNFGNTNWSIDSLYKWFDKNKIIEIKTTKFRFADSIIFALNINDKNNYQYDVSEVYSSEKLTDIVDKIEESETYNTLDKLREYEIVSNIASGEIREYDYEEYITPIEYRKYSSAINRAFKYRAKLVHSNPNRNMLCIYIEGPSGSGKTTFAKNYALAQGYKENQICIAGGSRDPLEDYKAQPVLILDDLRAETMNAGDLIKMLDNHTASKVNSRYRNKYLDCNLLIITSVINIEDFFSKTKNSDKEPIEQFKRRCPMRIVLTNKSCYIYQYDENKKNYNEIDKIDNPLSKLLPDYSKENKETQEKIVTTFDNFKNFVTEKYLAQEQKEFYKNIDDLFQAA